jgi:xylan 1,4-beta-xylosidase
LLAELDGRDWTAETTASFTGRVIGLYASEGVVTFADYSYSGTDRPRNDRTRPGA